MLPQKRKDQIAAAVASGMRAKRTAGGLTILPAASRNIVLAKHGEPTAAGKHYYSLSGEQPPVSDYDPNQAPVLRGTATYITGRTGKPVKLRYMGADGSFRYTVAGQRYYAQRQDEHIVSVPVTIMGKRANGRAYTREDHFPVDHLGVTRIMVSQDTRSVD